MKINITVLYIWIQGHRDVRKEVHKDARSTSWSGEPHTDFVAANQYLRERTNLGDFVRKTL